MFSARFWLARAFTARFWDASGAPATSIVISDVSYATREIVRFQVGSAL